MNNLSKYIITLLFSLLCTLSTEAQVYYTPVKDGVLVKDLDGDSIKDTIYLEYSKLVCRLSTDSFKKIQSKEIEQIEIIAGFHDITNSSQFIFYYIWGTQKCLNTFQYNKEKKEIQLIDISLQLPDGYSTLNLQTNDFFGHFEFLYSEFRIGRFK